MKKRIHPTLFKIAGRIVNLLVFMTAIVLVVSSFPLTACSTTSGKQVVEPATVKEPAAQVEQASPVQTWGIEVTSVRMTANNHMIDFRYRVLDPQKAETLFSKETKPYLIHRQTGKVLSVPRTAKVGPLMSTYHPQQNRIYWMFFGNHGNLVKAGDQVSVVIGEFRAENIIVQ